ETKIIMEEEHQYRGDRSVYMIRSSQPRLNYKEADIPSHDTFPIKRGDIVICNNNFGQYKGELQIALRDMENDGDRNVVGKLKEGSLFLLDYLQPWTAFKIIE